MKKTNKPVIKRTVSALLAAALTTAMAFATSTAGPVYAGNASVQKYEEQIAALEAEQAELEEKIAGIEGEQEAAASRKEYLDSLANTVGQKIQASETLVAELDSQIKASEEAIKDFEASIAETTERIKERMVLNQESGQGSLVEVLIGTGNIKEFLSNFERLSDMLEYDRENLEKYKEQKAAMEQQVKDLKASKELQEQTLKALENDRAESERLAEEAASYWNDLQSDKAEYQKQYAAAKAAEQALDNELSAMLREISQQNSSQVTANGEFMWPLPVGQGYISCYYGDSDPNGAPHYAVDCAIAGGTPIYASNDGYVVRAEGHWSYGNYIVLDHGNGKSTLYAHCSALAVSAGQSVAKGQVIGYVGTTGFSTGCHLHFEFRVNGTKVNPLGYMSAGC